MSILKLKQFSPDELEKQLRELEFSMPFPQRPTNDERWEMYQLAVRSIRVFNAPKVLLKNIDTMINNYKKALNLYENGAVVDMHNDQVCKLINQRIICHLSHQIDELKTILKKELDHLRDVLNKSIQKFNLDMDQATKFRTNLDKIRKTVDRALVDHGVALAELRKTYQVLY